MAIDFDITRCPNRHLGFGTDEQFRLRAHVARLSMRALLHELANRIEAIALAVDPTQIASSFVMGPESLPVHYMLRTDA